MFNWSGINNDFEADEDNWMPFNNNPLYERMRASESPRNSYADVTMSPLNSSLSVLKDESPTPWSRRNVGATHDTNMESIHQHNASNSSSSRFDESSSLFSDHSSPLHNQQEYRPYTLFPKTSSPRDTSLFSDFSDNSFNTSLSPDLLQDSPDKYKQSTMIFGARTPNRHTANSTPIKYKEKPLGAEVPKMKMCTFCRKNSERPSVYLSHVVREWVGRKKVVTCPILRSYVCPACGESGDKAHTIAYCPKLNGNVGNKVQSITIALKNTKVQSKGIRKFYSDSSN